MKVFIENQAGFYVKHLYDEKNLELQGTLRVSRKYPFPYGFVLETRAEDGDNVDCFVLTKQRLHSGALVECEPVGLMEQIEDDKTDHNVLAVVVGEEWKLDDTTKRTLVEFVNHVFDHLPGKTMKVGEFRDRQAAIEFVRQRSQAAKL